MFRGLKGRQVIVTLLSGEGIEGTVERAGFTSADIVGFTGHPADGSAPAPAVGLARISVRQVSWLQVL